jgi:hypothetical protein
MAATQLNNVSRRLLCACTQMQVYWTGSTSKGRAVVVAFDIYGFGAGRSRQICDSLVSEIV